MYSVVNVNSTKPYQGLPQNLFDLYTVTFMRFTREIGSFVSWELETMDNAVFNGFGIFNNVKVRDVFSSLYGYTVNQDEVEVALINDPEFKKVTRYEFATSVGLMGFHSFRYELNAIPRDVPNYAAFSLLYCKASSSMCPGIDQYPSVSEGQISPALCDYGFTGYAYRNWHGRPAGRGGSGALHVPVPRGAGVRVRHLPVRERHAGQHRHAHLQEHHHRVLHRGRRRAARGSGPEHGDG